MTTVITAHTSDAVLKALLSLSKLIKTANTCAQVTALLKGCDKTTELCLNEAERLIKLADRLPNLTHREYTRIETEVASLHASVDKITQQTHLKATQILRRAQ